MYFQNGFKKSSTLNSDLFGEETRLSFNRELIIELLGNFELELQFKN